ncbi:MAG: phosphoribosylanthranilate isomerase [Epsilonproteobacteria bacterium]|nr:phosphoribosylanthranilate isomerase [Campylobacterota bacterium]
MRVKICGITNYQDAIYASNQGADALGFVFYPKSPRYITPQSAKEIIAALPPFITKVALFVNQTAQQIDEICDFIQADYAQIHFDATKELYDNLKTKHIKVIRAASQDDIWKYPNEVRIIDAFTHQYGGSGKRIDLRWFECIDKSKIILAGGLNVDNIDEVVNLGFYGVDVSSGVEQQKGKKDLLKVAQFIQKAKKCL